MRFPNRHTQTEPVFLAGWNDRVVPGEPVLGIVLLLELPQSVQPPRLKPISCFKRLVTRGVVDIRRRFACGLASIP